MDIFDLSIEDFEKKVDEILEGITDDELLNELIENGLIIDEYEGDIYYIEEDYNNIWVHKTRTSNLEKILNLLNNKRENENLLEAA